MFFYVIKHVEISEGLLLNNIVNNSSLISTDNTSINPIYIGDGDQSVLTYDFKTGLNYDKFVCGSGIGAITVYSNNLVFVTNSYADYITILRLKDGNILHIPTGLFPCGAISDNAHIWVVNQGSNNVVLIDIITYKLVKTIPLGTSPNHVIYDGNNNVIISVGGSKQITLINIWNYKILSIDVGDNDNYPIKLFYDINNVIWILCSHGLVQNIDINNVLTTRTILYGPMTSIFVSASKYYVGSHDGIVYSYYIYNDNLDISINHDKSPIISLCALDNDLLVLSGNKKLTKYDSFGNVSLSYNPML